MTATILEPRRIPTAQIREAPWNANKQNKRTMARLRNSIRMFNIVENSVVRPGWCVGARTTEEVERRRGERDGGGMPDPLAMTEAGDGTWYETLSGNHRLKLYQEEGLEEILVVVVELPDPQAKVLAQALNRVRGTDDPERLKDLLSDVLRDLPAADVTDLLPHSEKDLLAILDGSIDEAPPPPPEGEPDSKVGQVYQLGPHRLLCGDATDRDAVAELMAGEVPILLNTDPPYGVALDQGWRDRCGLNGYGLGRLAPSQSDTLAGDEGFAWAGSLGIVPCTVAYMWHASACQIEAEQHLMAAGYDVRQQIIWVKDQAAMGRQSYHWKHEPCFYAVRKGHTCPWYGGRAQYTVWSAPSPKHIMSGRGNEEDGKHDHPTQKPLVIFETPIINHLKPGEKVYDPFLGSGTCLIAAARVGRVCYGAELNPKYADVIRRRWTRWAMDNGEDPGTGALGNV